MQYQAFITEIETRGWRSAGESYDGLQGASEGCMYTDGHALLLIKKTSDGSANVTHWNGDGCAGSHEHCRRCLAHIGELMKLADG